MRFPAIVVLACVLACTGQASAEVTRIEVTRRDDVGTHQRLIGKVYFSIDPADKANSQIADVMLAPRNAEGRVEFSGDLLFFQPKDVATANGTVFFEVVNRGRDQSLGLMSDAQTRNLAPANWDLGDRFVLEQGFTVAFLGWQFDVEPDAGLTFQAPIAPVEGLVRATYIDSGVGNRPRGFAVAHCAADPGQATATLTFRARFEDPPTPIARDAWQFTPDGCAVLVKPAEQAGVFEAVYTAKGSAVAGLGLAAIRDFTSYLKYGGRISTLRETPQLSQRVVGFGYSQSGRLLREFVRDGFNRDERGRKAFDALMIASAGAGSFNHRFAMPGQAGNSVLSILRPVDLPPFIDEDLLARSRADGVTPRIFYTLTSTEYWARAGSLTHTTDDGLRDVALAPSSRLYFLTGTAHASGPQPRQRGERFRGYTYGLNFAEQRWVLRALLLDLDAWIRSDTAPPASTYPTIARSELVPRERVRFPLIPGLPFAEHVPPVFRMDLGAQFTTTRVITREPPTLGAPYAVLVPQVNSDGNDVGGVALPDVSVPLGTFTGWNLSDPPLPGLRYLAGLIGAFQPLAKTREERERTGDPRPSIAERYPTRQVYLDAVRRAADALVAGRFLRRDDVDSVVAQAAGAWSALAD
ncbi:MAG: alpha/beta hydrolase domain-containing protein [Vicinamibacterales bacterium]